MEGVEDPYSFPHGGSLRTFTLDVEGVRFLMRRNPVSPLVKYKQGPPKRKTSQEQEYGEGTEASIPLRQAKRGVIGA